MVTGMDFAVGQVVGALQDYGLYENSVILWSSDVSNHNYQFEKNKYHVVRYVVLEMLMP